MARKTFTTSAPPERELGFTLSGVIGRHHPTEAGQDWSEDFDCVDDLPVAVISEVQYAAAQENGRTVFRPAPVTRFLRRAVLPDQQARFDALCEDHHRFVDLETLVEVMLYLFEEYTDRPTGPATTSDGGQPATED